MRSLPIATFQKTTPDFRQAVFGLFQTLFDSIQPNFYVLQALFDALQSGFGTLEPFFGLALGFDELGDGGLQAIEAFFDVLEAFFGFVLGFDELRDGGLQAVEAFFGAAVRFDELLHQFGEPEQFFAQDEPAQLGPPLRMGLQESNKVVKVLNLERHGLSSKDLSAREIRGRCRTVSDSSRGTPDG